MISENDIRLIEQYLNQELNAVQVTEVERRIAGDAEFALQLEIIRDLPAAVTMETEQFRSDLRTIMQDSPGSTNKLSSGQKASKRVSLLRSILSVAAVIAGITLAINLLLPAKNTDLYTAYFVIPEENITVRNESDIDPLLTEAAMAYSGKNYALAAESFKRILDQNANEKPALFFYAITLMATEQYDIAQPVLIELLNQESTYANAAKWYLGLIYLKKKDYEKGKVLFNQLQSSVNTYSERASEILEQIPR